MNVDRVAPRAPQLGAFQTATICLHVIEVLRKVTADTVDDYREETILLAHEFGHHQSHLAGKRSEDYQQITTIFFGENCGSRGTLSDAQVQEIYDEEVRAWAYGLESLEDQGFPDMDEARANRDRSLEIYRQKLGLNL